MGQKSFSVLSRTSLVSVSYFSLHLTKAGVSSVDTPNENLFTILLDVTVAACRVPMFNRLSSCHHFAFLVRCPHVLRELFGYHAKTGMISRCVSARAPIDVIGLDAH